MLVLPLTLFIINIAETLPLNQPRPTTRRPGCFYNGEFREPGSFKASPCTTCTCDSSGWHSCAPINCGFRFPPCVNPELHPDNCCPICPDGPNCYAGNKIIPAGEDVHVAENTICTCTPQQPGYIYSGNTAICRPATTLNPPRIK